MLGAGLCPWALQQRQALEVKPSCIHFTFLLLASLRMHILSKSLGSCKLSTFCITVRSHYCFFSMYRGQSLVRYCQAPDLAALPRCRVLRVQVSSCSWGGYGGAGRLLHPHEQWRRIRLCTNKSLIIRFGNLLRAISPLPGAPLAHAKCLAPPVTTAGFASTDKVQGSLCACSLAIPMSVSSPIAGWRCSACLAKEASGL